jgi:hypothetical protein
MYQPTTLSDRKKYKQLLAEEKSKPNPNPQLVEEYNARQITAKLLCNAGAGLYADKHFHFHN